MSPRSHSQKEDILFLGQGITATPAANLRSRVVVRSHFGDEHPVAVRSWQGGPFVPLHLHPLPTLPQHAPHPTHGQCIHWLYNRIFADWKSCSCQENFVEELESLTSSQNVQLKTKLLGQPQRMKTSAAAERHKTNALYVYPDSPTTM